MKTSGLAILAVLAMTLGVFAPAGVAKAPKKHQAAAHVSKAKKAKRGPRGFRGKVGPQGPVGPKGDKGDKGEPGPLVDTLPVGKTLRGTYLAGATAAAGGAFAFTTLSFPIPLAAKPATNIIGPGGGPTAACPGSVTNPQAASGNFCLYVQKNLNVSATGGLATCDTAVDGCPSISRFGGGVQVISNAAGVFLSQGTWAVTG